jgi:sugar lactone lactonase YvrE
MKTKNIFAVIAVVVTLAWQTEAQIYDTNNVVVQTFAGSGFSGHVDGVGQLTMFNNPDAIAADSSSNLFVLDGNNYLIRKITPSGTVTTFAGGGNQTIGNGTNATVFYGGSSSIVIDHSNTLWLAGYNGFLVRVGSDANVSAILLNGMSWPWGVCADSANNLYISDYTGHKIYRYSTSGILSVFAGSGNPGYANGSGIFTSFHYPAALAADTADNIYVWDSYNGLIRKIDQSQNVTTFAGHYNPQSTMADGAGTNAAFKNITAMSFDGFGNLILYDNSCVRKISPATYTVTMAGSFTQSGYVNGAGNDALFYYNGGTAMGVCFSQGMVFVADSGNQRIRQISFNPQPQVVAGANLGIGTFAGVTITGTVGRTYQVQSSPDMASWTTRATLLLTSSPFLWIDQNPVNGNKFYRAVMLP